MTNQLFSVFYITAFSIIEILYFVIMRKIAPEPIIMIFGLIILFMYG